MEYEAGTSPFVCTERTHVAGTAQARIHKAHVSSFLCVAGTVHTMLHYKFEVILSLLHKARIQTS